MAELPASIIPEILKPTKEFLALGRSLRAAAQLRSIIHPTLPVFALPDWRGIFENLERKADCLERMLLVLGWPPPGHLPATLLDEITDEFHAENLTPSDVEELFVHFYTADLLRELTTEWRLNGHFPHRIRILEAAVAAHVEGRFELSVPAMLPQIEGVIADFFGHIGRMNNAALQQYLVAAFSKDSHFDRVSAAFILNVILESFFWGAKIPRLSRHAILHGADTRYATAINSLQVILAFDELQRSISYVASVAGTRFHLATCLSMRRAKSRRIFRNLDEARRAALLPCQRCLRHLAL
jgi:hypothetical protein